MFRISLNFNPVHNRTSGTYPNGNTARIAWNSSNSSPLDNGPLSLAFASSCSLNCSCHLSDKASTRTMTCHMYRSLTGLSTVDLSCRAVSYHQLSLINKPITFSTSKVLVLMSLFNKGESISLMYTIGPKATKVAKFSLICWYFIDNAINMMSVPWLWPT